MKKWTYYYGDIREVELTFNVDNRYIGFVSGVNGVVTTPQAITPEYLKDTRQEAINYYIEKLTKQLQKDRVIEEYLEVTYRSVLVKNSMVASSIAQLQQGKTVNLSGL